MNKNGYGSVRDLQEFLKRSYESLDDRNKIRDFFDSSLEDSLMPKEKIWSYVRESFDKPWAFNYFGPQGDEGLRIELSRWYLGDENLANNFMVTSGAQEALAIIIQFLNKKQKKRLVVGVEEFTYIGFRHILEEQGNEIRLLKLSEDGLQIDNLEREVKRGMEVLYIIPDFQNPTGIVYSNENRRKIVELQKKYNFWLILDLSYRDLYFSSEFPGIDMFKHEKTFFAGSFSKTMFPALRIGWLFSPKMYTDLIYVRRMMDLFQPTFLQLAMSKYLACDYKEHIKLINEIGKDKKNLLMKELVNNGFGNFFQWNDVMGGYYLWLKKHDGKSCKQLVENWSRLGVIVPLGLFFNPLSGANYIRLCFNRLSVGQIRETLKRISFNKSEKKGTWKDFVKDLYINSKICIR